MCSAISSLGFELFVIEGNLKGSIEISILYARGQRVSYRKIPQISPGAYIFQRPFLRGLYSKGLIYGGKFVFQNRLS